MLFHSQILIPMVISAVGVFHNGDCTCDSGAEGLLLRSLPATLLCQCALALLFLLPTQVSGQFDL